MQRPAAVTRGPGLRTGSGAKRTTTLHLSMWRVLKRVEGFAAGALGDLGPERQGAEATPP